MTKNISPFVTKLEGIDCQDCSSTRCPQKIINSKAPHR